MTDNPPASVHKGRLPPEIWAIVVRFLVHLPDQSLWEPWIKYRTVNRIFKEEVENYYLTFYLQFAVFFIDMDEMVSVDDRQYPLTAIYRFNTVGGPDNRMALFIGEIPTGIKDHRSFHDHLDHRLKAYLETGYHPYVAMAMPSGYTDLLPVDIRFKFIESERDGILFFDWRTYFCTFLSELRAIDFVADTFGWKSQVQLAVDLHRRYERGELSNQAVMSQLIQAAGTDLVGRDGRLLAIRRRRRYRLGIKSGRFPARPGVQRAVGILEKRFEQLDEEHMALWLLNLACFRSEPTIQHEW